MFTSTKDEEAEIIVPAVANDADDEPSPAKKTCCTLTMEIIKTSLIGCTSLFLLIWSIVRFEDSTSREVRVDGATALVILASLCYCGATSLDVVLKSKEGGVGNIVFGSLGIFAAVCWLIGGILTHSNIIFKVSDSVFPALWMIGSATNISVLIFELIKLCKSKEKSGCKYVLILIGLIFAIVANVFFISFSAWRLYTVNNLYGGGSDDNNFVNDEIWNFNLDDDFYNYRHLSTEEYGDYGDAYDAPPLDHVDRSLFIDDDLFGNEVNIRVLFLRGPSGLLIGGSLMYVVHSVLEIVVISMCCCN